MKQILIEILYEIIRWIFIVFAMPILFPLLLMEKLFDLTGRQKAKGKVG